MEEAFQVEAVRQDIQVVEVVEEVEAEEGELTALVQQQKMGSQMGMQRKLVIVHSGQRSDLQVQLRTEKAQKGEHV